MRAALKASGIAAGRLTVEITESIMMGASPAAMTNAAMLRDMGVVISMDDFGTGYSSLSHLARLPVSELKIDRQLHGQCRGQRSGAGAGHRGDPHRREPQAARRREGVETNAQRRFPRGAGVRRAAGYLFGEAMSPAGFAQWFDLRQARPMKGVA